MAKSDTYEDWIANGQLENNLAIIQSLSMQGKSIAEIADTFGVSRRTFMYLQKKHFALKKAIESGRLSVVALCQNKLMERVTSGDTTAIIYALKVYGGEFFNDRKNSKNDFSGTSVAVQPQVQVYIPKQSE